jgi:hypothetical protein
MWSRPSEAPILADTVGGAKIRSEKNTVERQLMLAVRLGFFNRRLQFPFMPSMWLFTVFAIAALPCSSSLASGQFVSSLAASIDSGGVFPDHQRERCEDAEIIPTLPACGWPHVFH